jgi:hypothetical protein
MMTVSLRKPNALLNLGQQVSLASQWYASEDNKGLKLLPLSLNGLALRLGRGKPADPATVRNQYRSS